MNAHPTALSRTDDGSLQIVWNDGQEQVIPVRALRNNCPCAGCREDARKTPEKGGLRVLSPAETRPLAIDVMHPVGNYAYNIHFSDGHTTGIFTFDHLRRLSAEPS